MFAIDIARSKDENEEDLSEIYPLDDESDDEAEDLPSSNAVTDTLHPLESEKLIPGVSPSKFRDSLYGDVHFLIATAQVC